MYRASEFENIIYAYLIERTTEQRMHAGKIDKSPHTYMEKTVAEN